MCGKRIQVAEIKGNRFCHVRLTELRQNSEIIRINGLSSIFSHPKMTEYNFIIINSLKNICSYFVTAFKGPIKVLLIRVRASQLTKIKLAATLPVNFSLSNRNM